MVGSLQYVLCIINIGFRFNVTYENIAESGKIMQMGP